MGVTEKVRGVEPRLFAEQDLEEPLTFSLDHGDVAFFSRSSPGSDAPNEDASAVLSLGKDGAVLAVADGLGGARAGQHASALAVQCVEKAVSDAVAEGREIRAGILDGFERANEEVRALGVGAATTLTVAEIRHGTARAYHVGDSFVLVTGNRGRIKLQSISHSPVGYGVESGLLDSVDAMHHDERHFVSNFVGTPDMHIEVGSPLELSPHDTIVLGSDGLSDNLHTREIVECVRKGPLRRASRELARRARERMETTDEAVPSKPDDLTFLIYRSRNAASTRRRKEAGSIEG